MSKKIKTPVLDKTKQAINIPKITKEEGLCFNFKDYKKNSIEIDGFNNCFQNEKESFSVMNKSLEKLKHISNCPNFNSVQSDTGMHCHAIEGDFKELVKEVLKKYGFPDRKIEELFEGKIYQVKIADGAPESRLVFYLIGGYILMPLFLDTNHQLYKSKKRGYDNNLKSKHYSL